MVDPLAKKYVAWNTYSYVLDNPVRLVDPDGRYVKGEATTSLAKFMRVFRLWELEAGKLRTASWIKSGIQVEGLNRAKFRVFDHDFRATTQLVNTVGGKSGFSYNKSFGKYLNVGLPLDISHFFKMTHLAQENPDWIVRMAYIREEYKQSEDPRPAGRTSAFSPEDIFSNELGIIFGSGLGISANMGTEFEVFMTEVNALFTTNVIKNGKYLTSNTISRLRGLAQKYYGTSDLTEFNKDNDIYTLDNIRNINNNAANGVLPLTGTPASQGH